MPAFTRLDLEKKIKEIYGVDTISHLIDTQITKYVTKNGYSYLDIARALAYHFIVNEGDLSKASGIGIVPYVMADAKKYFEEQALRVKSQLEQSEKYKKKPLNTIICKTKIKKPHREKPYVDLSSIEVNDSDE